MGGRKSNSYRIRTINSPYHIIGQKRPDQESEEHLMDQHREILKKIKQEKAEREKKHKLWYKQELEKQNKQHEEQEAMIKERKEKEREEKEKRHSEMMAKYKEKEQ